MTGKPTHTEPDRAPAAPAVTRDDDATEEALPDIEPDTLARDASGQTGERATANSARDSQGLVAGRYRIRERIARGGQATVYLASQEPLGRLVALKVLNPPLHVNAPELSAFKDRFLLEARTLAQLHHPNIVVIYDYGELGPNECYIAMEYVDGVRYSDVLRERPLDPNRTLGLAWQVCDALRYAHHHGVIHRDIKNSNVLISRAENGVETVKVVDFGIVKLLGQDAQITQLGTVLGSPHFMAPEQAQGLAVDQRTDIYAAGVLMYCGLMGRYPFDGPTVTAIIAGHLTRALPTFAQVRPDHGLPAGLEAVVARCLAKNPDDRYPSMDELLEALRPYVTGSQASPAPQLGSPAPTDTPDRTPTITVATGIGWLAGLTAFLTVILIASIIVLVILWRARTPAPVPPPPQQTEATSTVSTIEAEPPPAPSAQDEPPAQDAPAVEAPPATTPAPRPRRTHAKRPHAASAPDDAPPTGEPSVGEPSVGVPAHRSQPETPDAAGGDTPEPPTEHSDLRDPWADQ